MGKTLNDLYGEHYQDRQSLNEAYALAKERRQLRSLQQDAEPSEPEVSETVVEPEVEAVVELVETSVAEVVEPELFAEEPVNGIAENTAEEPAEVQTEEMAEEIVEEPAEVYVENRIEEPEVTSQISAEEFAEQPAELQEEVIENSPEEIPEEFSHHFETPHRENPIPRRPERNLPPRRPEHHEKKSSPIPMKSNFKPIFRRNLIAGLIFLTLATVGCFLFLSLFTRHGRELSVPDFATLSMEDAQALARKESLRVEVIDSVFVRRLNPGAVFSQNPVAGSKVKKNRRILLTVNSTTPKTVKMPSLVGFSLRQAKAVLLSKGLKVGKLIYQNDMATNNVLGQKIKGRDIAKNSVIEVETPVDLVLGLNESDSETYVPFVKGFSENVARNAINDNSLNVGRVVYDSSVETYADSVRAVVYRQEPAGGSGTVVTIGSSVNIYLTLDQTKLGVDTK